MDLTREDLQQADRKWRLNLINSISGIKPANLIGTRSLKGENNLAIFSSVVHLGSDPAQMGMVLRPKGKVPRHTFENIKETGFYTINHVNQQLIKKAHYTSAKLPRETSEFKRMQIEEEYLNDFLAPFVKISPVKIAMRFEKEIDLPNGCSFIIGTVEFLRVPENGMNDLGQLNLEQLNIAGLSGLNTYYGLKKMETFPYVRENEIPDFG